MMKFDYKKFRADLITKRLIEHKMSTLDLAKSVGCHEDTIIDAETGENAISVEDFTKLCGWLGKNPSDYFLTGAPVPRVAVAP